MSDSLPFYRLESYPGQVTGPLIMVRLLDGLGFRFHWATEGLTEQDYAFTPGEGTMTIGQLIEHIWSLINWLSWTVRGEGYEQPEGAEHQRSQALQMLQVLRDHVASVDGETLAAVTIDDLPFWHILNGPLADALTHVGQINGWRRLAGNPAPGARVFTGDPPGTKRP